MKALVLIVSLLFFSLLTSCEEESVPTNHKTLAGNILSRSNDKETLPEGSQILLNAYGGLSIVDNTFTYTNGTWTNDNGHGWKEAEETTYITALYPHDISNLYNEGALKDVLIAQDTLTQGEKDVTLTFRHLFASFILNVDETLVDKIKSIQLTSPQTIESISTSTGKITLSNTSTSTTLQGNGSNSYTFIIPPMEASITLNITLDNEISQSYKLQRHNFKSGFVYECGLRDWNTVPGIRSADDLETFSQLINEGKEAPAYGEKQDDGRMLYRLLADIDLKGVNLTPIGHNQDKPFDDIFNGEGYTISNFTVKAKGGFAGLFGQIGSDGVVKNLCISDYTISIQESASSGVGAIAGLCTGTISNCGVANSNITNHFNSYTGGITGTLRNGTIINSFVKDCQVTTTSASVGGVVGKIETGNIINCFSASNTITRSNNYSGGFCGRAEEGYIVNCYVYKQTLKTTTNRGQFIGHGVDSSVSHCYTNTASPNLIINNENESCSILSCKTYSSKFIINESHIVDVLNQWIESNQKNYDYPFTQWKEDPTGTLPAIFQ